MTDFDNLRMRLRTVLTDRVLDGRVVPEDIPLGGDGVGLDSLALVQFISNVERDQDAEVPIEIWADISQLSLNEFARALVSGR